MGLDLPEIHLTGRPEVRKEVYQSAHTVRLPIYESENFYRSYRPFRASSGIPPQKLSLTYRCRCKTKRGEVEAPVLRVASWQAGRRT